MLYYSINENKHMKGKVHMKTRIETNITKIKADLLRFGDVIMPPPRELSLWMNKHLKEHGLSNAALFLTITGMRETADIKGRWLVITCSQSKEWLQGSSPYPFRFKVRPETNWKMIKELS